MAMTSNMTLTIPSDVTLAGTLFWVMFQVRSPWSLLPGRFLVWDVVYASMWWPGKCWVCDELFVGAECLSLSFFQLFDLLSFATHAVNLLKPASTPARLLPLAPCYLAFALALYRFRSLNNFLYFRIALAPKSKENRSFHDDLCFWLHL